MQSSAATVDAYLNELPDDRRRALSEVRRFLLAHLDPVIEEGMQYGMIGYFIPHRVYPAGYHCDPKQPLPFAGLASQKRYMSVYLPVDDSVEAGRCDKASALETWFRRAWAKTGKKLDLGKCCLRFKSVDDLALDVIAELLRRVSADAYIARYEAVIGNKAKKKRS